MNLINLVKIYTIDALGINKIFSKENKPKKFKSILATIGMILILFFILNASFGYSILLSSMVNDKSLILGVMTAVSALLIFFTVIYIVKGVIVGFADYEMLMSLPIDTKTIIGSRILILYGYSFLLTLFILVPANIIYCITVVPPLEFYILSFIGLFLIPIVPMIIGCFLGLALQLLLAKMKNGSLWGILINLILFATIIIGVINITRLNPMLKNNIEAVIRFCTNAYPVGAIYTSAICSGNLISFLLFIIFSIASLGLFIYVVGIKFKKINTLLLTSKTNGKYKIKELKESSVFISLFKKELKRYLNCTIYVINTTFGIIMMLLIAMVVVFMGEEKIILFIGNPDTYNLIKMFIPMIFAPLIAFTNISSTSISIEGKNFWILKTIPVETITIFNAKIGVNLLMTIPISILSSILLAIGLNLDFKITALTIITSLIYCFFISISGLIINLLFPKLNWKSETAVVKQSLSTMISMIVGQMPVLITTAAVFFITGYSANSIIFISTIILAIITVVQYSFLKIKGSKIFNNIV